MTESSDLDAQAELLAERIHLDIPQPGSPHELELLRELLGQAQRLMATRPIINQAKGILIALEGCTPDEAFDVLRRASQRENRPIRTLALELVLRHQRQV